MNPRPDPRLCPATRGRAPLFFIAVIISIWGGTVQSRSQTSAVETVVRQRATAYWEAMARLDFEAASEFIAPESRKTFIFRVPKARITSWKITGLECNEEKTSCEVSADVARPNPLGVEMPAFPLHNRWVLDKDGQWYQELPWKEGENPMLQLFKGMQTAGPASSNPRLEPPPPGTAPPPRVRQARRLIPDPGNPASVHIGEKAQIKYTYVNSGTVPIRIISAHSDCHCTAVQQAFPEIAPGQTGTLTMEIDTFGLPIGPIFKEVSVTFTDLPKPEVVDLQLKVTQNFHIEPDVLNFGLVPNAIPTVKTVRIENQSGRRVKFLSHFNADGRLSVTLDKEELAPGESLVATFRYDSPEAGEFMDSITVRTDLIAEPLFSIPVRGRVIEKKVP